MPDGEISINCLLLQLEECIQHSQSRLQPKKISIKFLG